MNNPSIPQSLDELKREFIEKPFNQLVDIYHDAHQYDETFYPFIAEFAALLPNGAKVLDAGCATGGDTIKLIDHNLEVVGVDISPSMIKKAIAEIPQAEFHKMDVIRMSFDDNAFDGVWCSKTLSYIPKGQTMKALSEMKRILKPKGPAVFSVMEGNGEKIEKSVHDELGKIKTYHHYYTRKKIIKMLNKASFEVQTDYIVYDSFEERDYIVIFATAI